MELQQWKQNFIRDYLDEIDSLEVMDKLEKYTEMLAQVKERMEKAGGSIPYRFQYRRSKCRNRYCRKRIKRRKRYQRNGEPAFANRTKQYRSLVEGYYKIIYTMRKRSHDTSRFIMGLPSEPRQAQKTIRQI